MDIEKIFTKALIIFLAFVFIVGGVRCLAKIYIEHRKPPIEWKRISP